MDAFGNATTFGDVVQSNSTPVAQPTGTETANTTGAILGNVDGRNEFFETSPAISILSLTVLGVAGLVGTFGNSITLLLIAKIKNMRSVESIFVVNLAISDMMVTAIVDPISIIAKINGENFFDQIPGLCQTIASMCTVSCVTSLMTIGLLSINRYLCICAHAKYERIFTKYKCICMCITLYFVGGVLVLLNAADAGDHGFDKNRLECIWDRMVTYPYTVVFSVTLVWIPAVVIAACYLKIYLYVRAHRNRLREQDHGGNAQAFKRLNLVKTFFIIYTVFIACWAPYALLILVDPYDTYSHEIHTYITMFAHLHPSLNWFIYCITNTKYATAYKHLFVSCMPRQPHVSVQSNMVVPYMKPKSSDKQRSETCNRHCIAESDF